MTKKINYKKILEEVCNLVETDFCAEMDSKCLNKGVDRLFTQKEAKQMQKLLGQIYMKAHVIHCDACYTTSGDCRNSTPRATTITSENIVPTLRSGIRALRQNNYARADRNMQWGEIYTAEAMDNMVRAINGPENTPSQPPRPELGLRINGTDFFVTNTENLALQNGHLIINENNA